MSESDLMALAYRVYVGGLFVVLAIAALHNLGDLKRYWHLALSASPMKRTAAVLVANWIANTAFVITVEIYDAWFWFILTDAIAAAIVLHQPAGKPQSVVGGLYMAQIVMHGVYGVLEMSGTPVAENSYWQILIALAFAQLILVGGWAIGHHGGRLIRHLRLRRDPAVARRESRKGVAR